MLQQFNTQDELSEIIYFWLYLVWTLVAMVCSCNLCRKLFFSFPVGCIHIRNEQANIEDVVG